MTTLTTLPTYPPPARETQVIFTLTGSGANFVRVWVTIAPPDSELRAKLDESTQNRFEVHTGPGGAAVPWKFKFDKGGKYTLVAQEYTLGANASGGGYRDSPASAPSETKVGAEVTLSLFIGQRMTAEIGANGDSATLVLWVWDQTIRATSLGVHGEVTPALQNDNPTPRARAAIESATIVAALAALVNTTASSAVGLAEDHIDAFITYWNAHRSQGGVHNASDTDNSVPAGLAVAASTSSLKDAISEILPKMRYHYTNDAVVGGTVNGRDSADYHQITGSNRNDNRNLPIITGVDDVSAYWAIAELHRSYEAHRVSTVVHTAADATNALPALSPLLALASLFFGVLASTSPTVPPAQSTGAFKLITNASFAETPL